MNMPISPALQGLQSIGRPVPDSSLMDPSDQTQPNIVPGGAPTPLDSHLLLSNFYERRARELDDQKNAALGAHVTDPTDPNGPVGWRHDPSTSPGVQGQNNFADLQNILGKQADNERDITSNDASMQPSVYQKANMAAIAQGIRGPGVMRDGVSSKGSPSFTNQPAPPPPSPPTPPAPSYPGEIGITRDAPPAPPSPHFSRPGPMDVQPLSPAQILAARPNLQKQQADEAAQFVEKTKALSQMGQSNWYDSRARETDSEIGYRGIEANAKMWAAQHPPMSGPAMKEVIDKGDAIKVLEQQNTPNPLGDFLSKTTGGYFRSQAQKAKDLQERLGAVNARAAGGGGPVPSPLPPSPTLGGIIPTPAATKLLAGHVIQDGGKIWFRYDDGTLHVKDPGGAYQEVKE